MSWEVREFITRIRAASPEEQRLIIADEMALMRTAIREPDRSDKTAIIGKLIFLNIQGENTTFAQLEAVNLMASDSYMQKRVGYLAVGTLVDEQNDLLVLATHSVLKDLQARHPLVQALALSLIANKGSVEMCRSVGNEVAKLMGSEHPGVMKRAAAAAVTIIRKCPEMVDTFRSGLLKLYSSPKHAVVGGAILLTMEMIKANGGNVTSFLPLTKPLTGLLSVLVTKRPSMEFRFAHFNDPFLQVKTMKLLMILKQPSQELDDILTTIMTTVDTQRHPGRTLMLQAVETVCSVAKNSTLRALAFNQVGRLFSFRDPSVLYSALSVFGRVLYHGRDIIDRTSNDSIALQRHKAQIVQTLNHRDPSIRRRALDVILALVDETNVESLIPEVIEYLHFADTDFRTEMVAKIYTAIQRFAPSAIWSFDTVLMLILDSGDYIGSDVFGSFCRIIARNKEVQDHALPKLANIIYGYLDNQTLVSVTSWVLGEFQLTPIEGMLETLVNIMKMPQTKPETMRYVLVGTAKMAARWDKVNEVLDAFELYSKDADFEIQQRAGELLGILKTGRFKEALLTPVEVPVETDGSAKAQLITDDLLDIMDTPVLPKQSITATKSAGAELLALVDGEPQPTTAKPLPDITPPAGAVEALRTAEFVIYFEIQKNKDNVNQIAIRSTIFNLGMTPLTNFSIQYGVPTGWFVRAQVPSSTTLDARGGKPIQQLLYLENKGMAPLAMKTQTSYMFGCQPLKSVDNINPIF